MGGTGPLGPGSEPGYFTCYAIRKTGVVGGRHIREEGLKVAICGLKDVRWDTTELRSRPLETVYQLLVKAASVFNIKIKHRPPRPRTPCKRCLVAAQKLRPALDRMAEIDLGES
jgi:hypothetical protein